jgi:predicted esterase
VKIRKAAGFAAVTGIMSLALAASVMCAGRETPSPVYPPLPAGPSTVMLQSAIHAEQKNAAEIPVDIYVPRTTGFSGDVLVLPGWNFSRKKWQEQSGLIRIAGARGLRLIFPEMMKTLYESRYYPETRMKWALTPGGQWIKDILIPEMQKRGLLLPGGKNYLLGLSTGARGVALIALKNPGLFKAGAALSGDYNQAAMTGDRLMTAVYGRFHDFPERWTTDDNPQNMIDLWTMPIYLGHGKKDAVVPFLQTLTFHEKLKKAKPGLRLEFNAPENAGHDFTYWASEVEPAVGFFLSNP